MKILHIIPQLWQGNGAAKVVRDLAEHQINNKQEVSIIALCILNPSYYDELISLGVNVLYFEKEKYNLYKIKYFFKIRKILNNYDIIHVHLFPTSYWCVLARVFSRSTCKVILTEHSTKNNRQKYKIFTLIDKIIYSNYDKVVSISPAVDELLKSKYDLKNTIVINNGINLDNISKIDSYNRDFINIPQYKILITQVAKFNTQKDQKTLIKAIPKLPKCCHILFVGDGPLIDEHKQLVSELDIEKRVTFLGLRNDVISLLKSSDIIVMSSHYEGFGLAALEGMAVSKPVIASNVAGLSSIVKGAGLLFEKGNETELAEKIMSLINNKDLYDQISKQCYLRSLEYSFIKTGNKYLDLYKEIINNKK